MVSHEWLTFRGSLTEKMEQASGKPMTVKLLHQGVRPLFQEERSCLAIKPRQWGWIREVELSFDKKPWVLARTVIPLYAMTKQLRRVTLLGNRPLGPLLFSHLKAERCDIEFEKVVSTNWTGECIETPLWCRRSLFFIHQSPLLLRELFLPNHPVYGNE